ncbi:MAG: hypothetical protein ACI9IP_003277 [Arcticibacterium sp.]|jgi:hypothetical protein
MKRLIILLFISNVTFSQETLISQGETWEYLVDNTNHELDWINPWYDDSGWPDGQAPLGYGLPDVVSTIGYGGNLTDKYRTTYFRKTINRSDTSHFYSYYQLRVRRDDGVVVYVNGHEVLKNNMPENHDYQSYAASSCSDNGDDWQTIYVDGHLIVKGENVISAEVHQSSNASPDLFFELEMIGYFQVGLNQNVIIPSFDTWKYLDNGSNQGTAWKESAFNDASWSSGVAEFGFGDGDEATVISYGGNANNIHITTYFRKSFNTSSTFDLIELKLRRDDGAVVYLDGNEIYRDNLSLTGSVNYLLKAKNAEDDGEQWLSRILKGDVLTAGSHVIAVEIHQTQVNSSDLTFNLELIGLSNNANYIKRGPYLMKTGPTFTQIAWKTLTAANGKVMIGNGPLNLTTSFNDASVAEEHFMNITGLSPNTKYYYSVGTSSTVMQNLTDNYFITPPIAGTVKKTRILTMGDIGNGDQNQKLVTDMFLQNVQDKYIDLYLPLGDLVYRLNGESTDGGTEKNFDYNFFQMMQYDRIMKQTPIYPIVGNHEYYNYDNANIDFTNFNRPYFQLFNMPTAGEEGGVASGSERFYSFNKSNIHFVVLDAYGWDTYPTGDPANDTTFATLPHASSPLSNHAFNWEVGNSQMVWLMADLAANTQKWTVVSLHAPIYSKGSHDSDGPGDWYIPPIRAAYLPIFEQYDVDLVLSGHSHIYERSKLLRGHYLNSGDFNTALYPTGHVVSNSLATYTSSGTCPYIKNNGEKGIVYAVIGTGHENDGGGGHPAMTVTNPNNFGAMLIEIEGNQLDAKWIGENGNVLDQFTILKGVDETDSVLVQENTNVPMTASWASGSFSWSNASTTREISIIPPPGHNVYTVTDGFGCVTDTYHVEVIPLGCNSSPYNINYDIDPPKSLLYKTNTTIVGSKKMKVGTNVQLDAGQSISLNPGFIAEGGAVFFAKTGACPE